jgi:hypothetical protein
VSVLVAVASNLSYALKGVCLSDLRLPARHDWAVQEQHYGKLVMEPFEPGFTLTVKVSGRLTLVDRPSTHSLTNPRAVERYLDAMTLQRALILADK